MWTDQPAHGNWKTRPLPLMSLLALWTFALLCPSATAGPPSSKSVVVLNPVDTDQGPGLALFYQGIRSTFADSSVGHVAIYNEYVDDVRLPDTARLLLQAEYRWRINEFVTGALFYDTGAVGPALDDLGRVERNYGIGLRAGNRMGSAFRIDYAFGGREGNRLVIRFDDVF